jgi:hypothetical protein
MIGLKFLLVDSVPKLGYRYGKSRSSLCQFDAAPELCLNFHGSTPPGWTKPECYKQGYVLNAVS